MKDRDFGKDLIRKKILKAKTDEYDNLEENLSERPEIKITLITINTIAIIVSEFLLITL